jgi:hypothetical protein
MAGYLTERARLAGALRGEKKSAKDRPLMWDVASKESYECSSGSTWMEEKLGSTTVDYARIVSSSLALGKLSSCSALISDASADAALPRSAPSGTAARTHPYLDSQVLSQLDGLPRAQASGQRRNRH